MNGVLNSQLCRFLLPNEEYLEIVPPLRIELSTSLRWRAETERTTTNRH